MDVEPAGRSAVHQDDVELRSFVMIPVPDVLRLELLADERGFHLLGPVEDHGELLLAGAVVDP